MGVEALSRRSGRPSLHHLDFPAKARRLARLLRRRRRIAPSDLTSRPRTGAAVLPLAFAELGVGAKMSAGDLPWTVSASSAETLPSTVADVRAIFTALIVPAGLGVTTAKTVTPPNHPTTPHSASALRATGPSASVYHVNRTSPTEGDSRSREGGHLDWRLVTRDPRRPGHRAVCRRPRLGSDSQFAGWRATMSASASGRGRHGRRARSSCRASLNSVCLLRRCCAITATVCSLPSAATSSSHNGH